MLIRQLPVALTSDELKSYGTELAATIGRIGVIEVERKASAVAFKARLEELDLQVHDLAADISAKHTLRQVECSEHQDARRAVVELVREDTGEIVEVRAMTAAELSEARQVRLFDAGPMATSKRKPAKARANAGATEAEAE